MAVTNEETDFTESSSEWFHKVNRGGLFPIDETLTFLKTLHGNTYPDIMYCKAKKISSSL
jgi:hypothetical protein